MAMRRVCMAALGLALLGLACNGGGGGTAGNGIDIVVRSPEPSPTPKPTPTPATTPTPTPVPIVCGFNPDAATEEELQVQEPEPMAKVKSPFHVRGWGSAIAKTGVAVSIVDAQANVLEFREVSAQPRGELIPPPGLTVTDTTAPFAVDMAHTVESPLAVCLWVFQRAPGGDPTNVVLVPLLLEP
jgi:hypothetical protein